VLGRCGPDPFITTYLRSNTGFGLLLDARLPVLTEADTIAVLEGDIAFALLAFEYQQAIVDFLAVRIGFTGGARGAWSPIDWCDIPTTEEPTGEGYTDTSDS
jgi:hypothetical protein